MKNLPNAGGTAGEELETIFERLETACGLDLTGHHPMVVVGQVRARMARRNLATVDDYVDLIAASPEERASLRDAVLIGSTRFFRDDEVFAALPARALTPLCNASKGPLRIWVPGCSTGEEVYSILMLLHEQLELRGESRPIRVFATDVRQTALEHGRKGIYQARSCHGIPPARLERFFVPTVGGYQVVRRLRDQVLWARHDLTRNPPYPHIDLVSCRNLLIHVERATQECILKQLHFSLRPGGLLLLGSAESTLAADRLFRPVSLACRLYAKCAVPHRIGSSRYAVTGFSRRVGAT